MHITEVPKKLRDLHNQLVEAREGELMAHAEAEDSMVQDHTDHEEQRRSERRMRMLAKAWDKMIKKLDKWAGEAESITAEMEGE